MNPQNQNLTGIMANPYNTQGSNTLNLGNQSSNLPPVPNTLNAGNVGNFKPLNAPSGTQPSNFLNELTANYQTNLNQLQTQQQNQTNSISDLLNSLTGQTSDKISAENQAGLPALNTQARDLQALSQRQLAAYAQNIFNNDTVGGQYRSSQTGNEAMITRQHGIDAMITNANISAISGQIKTAEAQVDRAMSLKYDPIKQQIENQKFLLEQVNTKEARAASNVKDLQLKQIDRQQQNEKDINNVMIEAAKNQAPASVLANIKNATSVNDAVRAAGPYMADQVAKAIQYAQLAKLNAETSEILAKAKTEAAKNNPQVAGELKNQALTSAKEMAQQIMAGTASGAIGAKGVSSLFGLKGKPIAGTDAANFVNLYENFKSLLSLDNIKLLKGQGSVSDAERAILEKASSKLNRDSSESQFKKILYQTVNALGGKANEIDPYADAYINLPEGEILVKDRHTGQIGSIPEKEANAMQYEKL